MQERAGNEPSPALGAIASAFVAARREGHALGAPRVRFRRRWRKATPYRSLAIARFPDAVVGWKVGAIARPQRERDRDARLVGPIFRRALRRANGDEPVRFPVFDGGFAAVEAEFVFGLAGDAVPDKHHYDADEAAALVASMHVGIETAGSPLATINALGPTVVVADFGNNAGLILGPAIASWRARAPESLTCETFVAGASVGSRLRRVDRERTARGARVRARTPAARGRPLKAGDCVTTGAVTGIHDIVAGQSAHVVFDGIATLRCVAVAHGTAA